MLDGEIEISGKDTDACTVIEIAAELLPALLVPVIVYVVAEEDALGLPEIFPLDVLNDSPDGKVGEMLHEVAGDPEFEGAMLEIAIPTYAV